MPSAGLDINGKMGPSREKHLAWHGRSAPGDMGPTCASQEGFKGKGAVGNVHRDNLGSRGSSEVEAYSIRERRVYKAQKHGLVGHNSSIGQEQAKGTWGGETMGRCHVPA